MICRDLLKVAQTSNCRSKSYSTGNNASYKHIQHVERWIFSMMRAATAANINNEREGKKSMFNLFKWKVGIRWFQCILWATFFFTWFQFSISIFLPSFAFFITCIAFSIWVAHSLTECFFHKRLISHSIILMTLPLTEKGRRTEENRAHWTRSHSMSVWIKMDGMAKKRNRRNQDNRHVSEEY